MYFPLSLTTRKLYKTIKNSEAIVAAAAPFCLNTGIKRRLIPIFTIIPYNAPVRFTDSRPIGILSP